MAGAEDYDPRGPGAWTPAGVEGAAPVLAVWPGAFMGGSVGAGSGFLAGKMPTNAYDSRLFGKEFA